MIIILEYFFFFLDHDYYGMEINDSVKKFYVITPLIKMSYVYNDL